MFIYKLTNKINHKCYIGQTTRTVKERIAEHFSRSSKCIKLQKAISKYGRDNFIVETIDSAQNIEELNKKESDWIHFCDSINNGYNLVCTGDNKITSQETRNRLSKAGKGRKMGDGLKEKLLKIHSVEVFQYDLEGNFIRSFSSGAVAARHLGCYDASEIGKCCKLTRRQVKNYQWRHYFTPFIGSIKKRKIHNNQRRGSLNPKSKKVAKTDGLGNILEIYDSASEAAYKNDCDISTLCKVCKGIHKSTKGLFFIFL